MSKTLELPRYIALNQSLSPRALLFIVILVLHVLVLWTINSELSRRIWVELTGPTEVQFIPDVIKEPPPDTKPAEPSNLISNPVPIVTKPVIDVREDPDTAPTQAEAIDPANRNPGAAVPVPEPIIVKPQITRPLAEPTYPPASIRNEETGTVIIAVYILPDGRVGGARIERSSGHRRLDEAALRKAREWRFAPGTQNGTPTAMWMELPVTFQLTGR